MAFRQEHSWWTCWRPPGLGLWLSGLLGFNASRDIVLFGLFLQQLNCVAEMLKVEQSGYLQLVQPRRFFGGCSFSI